jgi:hypothetical protein
LCTRIYIYVEQCTATHCHTLPHTAAHSRAHYRTPLHRRTLPHCCTAAHCRTLPHCCTAAAHCRTAAQPDTATRTVKHYQAHRHIQLFQSGRPQNMNVYCERRGADGGCVASTPRIYILLQEGAGLYRIWTYIVIYLVQ